ncbi:MAG TPA: DUF1559 domain-containing protein [Gemmataceae bacterium]|jgi:hypothetical protein|nr:DUF1559 domain-containing protein [Gemmataceae bacterium]
MRESDSDWDDDPRPRRRPPSSGKTVLIIVGIVVGAVVLVVGGGVALMFYAVQSVRGAAERTMSANNIKQMSLGLHNQHDITGSIAPSINSPDGKPLLSWRVALLPYIENDNLYRQFKLDEPWDGPNNSRLLPLMPRVYHHPADGAPTSNTHYRVFVGGGAMFDYQKKTKLNGSKPMPDEITIGDGASNTVMIVEAADAVPWTKPDELNFDPNLPLPELGLRNRKYVVIGLADASFRFVQKKDLNPVTLKALITANGGETLPPDW